MIVGNLEVKHFFSVTIFAKNPGLRLVGRGVPPTVPPCRDILDTDVDFRHGEAWRVALFCNIWNIFLINDFFRHAWYDLWYQCLSRWNISVTTSIHQSWFFRQRGRGGGGAPGPRMDGDSLDGSVSIISDKNMNWKWKRGRGGAGRSTFSMDLCQDEWRIILHWRSWSGHWHLPGDFNCTEIYENCSKEIQERNKMLPQ